MFRLVRESFGRRTLVWVLVRRALITRYRGTALGFMWTFLHPLVLFVVYAWVFGYVLKVETPEGNFATFLLAGLLPWTWFGQSVAMSSTSILGDAGWIRQAAFPPPVSPIVVNVATLVNFALELPVLLVILAFLGAPPSLALFALLPVVLIQFVFALGLSLGVAALTVRYRDVAQLVQAILTPWFFATPILYPVSMIPERMLWVNDVNPMAHLSKAYQDILFRGVAPDPVGLAGVFVVSLVVVFGGNAIMNSMRDRIPEEL